MVNIGDGPLKKVQLGFVRKGACCLNELSHARNPGVAGIFDELILDGSLDEGANPICQLNIPGEGTVDVHGWFDNSPHLLMF